MIAGYRKKPLWIYLFAVGLTISPVIMLSYAFGSRAGWHSPGRWLTLLRFVSISTWILCTMQVLAGLGLLFVRRWSWQFALLTMGAITAFDIVQWKSVGSAGIATLAVMVVVTLGFAALISAEMFRRPYLNPRLRWWETSLRFRADLPVQVEAGVSAVLVDISRTGLLIEWAEGESPPLKDQITISLPSELRLPCRLVRRTDRGCGLQFMPLDGAQRTALNGFLKTLAEEPSRLAR